MYKKGAILILLVVVGLLVITNPSEKDFYNYIKHKTGVDHVSGARTGYYLVFSTFHYRYSFYTVEDRWNGVPSVEERHEGRYVGCFLNFFEM